MDEYIDKKTIINLFGAVYFNSGINKISKISHC